MMHDRLQANAVPVQLPIGRENTFTGVVDLIKNKAFVYYDDLGKDIREEEIPADMVEQAAEARLKLVEAVSETDEELLENIWRVMSLLSKKSKSLYARATIDNIVVPVFCGSSYKNKGVQLMLDGVIKYMPAPTDIAAIDGVLPNGEEAHREGF